MGCIEGTGLKHLSIKEFTYHNDLLCEMMYSSQRISQHSLEEPNKSNKYVPKGDSLGWLKAAYGLEHLTIVDIMLELLRTW